MQPTLPQTAGTADMDLTAVQSMDWFFKKEQIYLLAQFWQQRATLAEKEVNTLKEQLSTTDGTTASTENESNGDLACGNNTNEANTENTALSDIPPNSKLLNSVAAAITLHQNGGNLLATTPSPSPPHSESGVAQNQEQQQQQLNGCLNPKLFFNHAQQVMMMEAAAAAAAAAVQQQHSPMHSPQSNNGNHEQDLQQQQQQQPTNNNNNISNINNNNNTSKTMNCSDRTTTITTQDKSHETSNTATESDTQCIKDNDTINNENEQDEVAREEDKDKSRINTSKEEADTANNTNSSSNNNNNNTSLTQQCIDNISDNSFNCSSSSDSNIKNSLNSSKNTPSASTTTITATFNQNLKDSESLSTTLLQQQLQQQPPPNLHDSRIEHQSHALELHDQRGSEKNNALNYHMELLAAKNKEIKTLFEEVKRLRAIEQNHLVQIHRLEEHLEAKRQHIIRLEAKLDKQQINEALQESQQALLHKTNKSQTLETMEIEDDEEEQQVDDEPVEIVNPKTTVDQTQVAEQTTKEHSQTSHSVHTEENVVDDDDDEEPEQNVDQHTENSNAATAAAASTQNCDANENKENESDKQNSKEDYLNTNIAENLKEIKIKKETQSPLSLDSISQQNAIAAAAAAAAACNNDPNKFQELLLERTKALAAEALKNSEETCLDTSLVSLAITQDKSPSDSHDAKQANAASLNEPCNISKVPKIEILDEDDDDDDGYVVSDKQKVTLQSSLTMQSTLVATSLADDKIIDLAEDNNERIIENDDDETRFKQNVERFGSLLGEELVNSYWRRGFDYPAKSLNSTHVANAQQHAQQHSAQQQQQQHSAQQQQQQQHHHHQHQHALHNHHQQQQQQQHHHHHAMMMQHTVPHFQQQPTATTSHMLTHVQQQQQQQPQTPQSCGPSSTALLTQLVNSTFPLNNSCSTNSSSALRSTTDPYHHHSSAHHLHHSMHNHHQMAAEHHHLAEKTLTHPESNAITASSMQESSGSRNTSDDLNASINGSTSSKANNIEDNNNSLSATPTGHMPGHPAHLPHGFLPSLPFQFQDRGHFRFADDLQLPPGTSMAGRLGESLIPKGDPMEAKLQEMLRYNMDKYANQALDTLHISRRVRELLSVHNIGQRIFAKYVLGLSQGTVSELLSKPKPWDKLTEKGRDSYRKMHAWSCDDNAVILLKSLIPKKDSGLPPFGGREESMSDERLAHILNEASSLMKSTSSLSQSFKDDLMQRRSSALNNTEDTHSNDDSKSPPPQALSPSPFFKDQSKLQNESIQKPEEMNPEKMARFYQEIMSRAPREAFPGGPMPAGMVANPAAFPGLAAAGGDENMRLAFEREMSKLQQHQQNQPPNFANLSSLMALQQQMITGAQDLTLGKDDAAALSKEIKLNGQSNNSLHGSNNSLHTLGHSTPNAKENSSSTAADVDRLYPGLVKTEQGSKTPAPLASSNASTANTNSAAPSPLSNSILPPAMTPSDDFSAVASPLQRMASITNSLITQPPVPPHHTPPQRPTKAVLPPITQQQFDMFNNLNTEDIVRRVKEALSQYSISQRLFGESVLGLSQGSVSDLLARPKPWHMLTQKGREPFIRMKMFLEDENAVHKLVASQYKIAPEKLMRTGNFNGPPQLPQGLASKMQASLPMQKMMNDLKLNEPAHIMQQMQAAAVMSAAMQQHQHQAAQAAAVQQSQQQHAAQAAAAQAAQAAQAAAAQAAQAAQQHHQSMLLTSPGLPPQHAIALPSAGGANSQPSSGSNTPAGPTPDKKPMMMPIHSPHQSNAMRNMHQHMSPTVYEMAALTQDLDTQVITTKIKEALLTNNIGQKIFGEAVLGLSQGSVSELLSKPKPWHMLSIKGREPFIRMQLWLSDANNVERLQMLKNERREASKRRRSTGPNQQDNSSDTSSNDTNDFYTSSPGPGSVGSQGAPPNKKQRVLFSEEQKEALRLAFALDPYPNVGTIEFLANELGLATRTITNWFHNHRMRLKQQVPHGPPGQETQIPTRENTNSTPFDPVQFRILLQQRLLELHKERLGLGGNPALPYPPYFAAAALLGRSLAGMPGAPGAPGAPTEADLRAFNLAIREQMSGLDLTMNAFKRERSDDFDDDGDDGHLSANDNDSINGDDSVSGKFDNSSLNALNQHFLNNLRSNRRKPAAPQWVNPASGPVGVGDNERLANGENEENLQHEDDKTNEPDDLEHEPLQASYMEPEVVIKQEKEDCDSDSENKPQDSSAAAVTIDQDERLKVLQEDKLRMVRVNRLSQEDEIESAAPASAMSAGWNY